MKLFRVYELQSRMRDQFSRTSIISSPEQSTPSPLESPLNNQPPPFDSHQNRPCTITAIVFVYKRKEDKSVMVADQGLQIDKSSSRERRPSSNNMDEAIRKGIFEHCIFSVEALELSNFASPFRGVDCSGGG
jgi:hypothetical protein